MTRNQALGLAAVASALAAVLCAYRLNEWEQAVITRFGKPVRQVKEAGLNFRVPFVEEVHRLDKRILNWDGEPNQIPTKDKKYIHVDTTARWRIADPLLFIQTVRNERDARARLDAILESATRDVVSRHNLVEAVRNSNQILDAIGRLREASARGDLPAGEEEVTGEIEKVTVGREALSSLIIAKAREALPGFGIELIDVQLRRIAYEASVEQKVYERMISERQRIAQKIRSVGIGEQAKVRGTITKDLQEIESEAYRKAQTIRGEAEAKAIRVYAAAMNADPDFYEFLRTLEAYKKGLREDVKLILSTDSKFLELLRRK